MPNWNRLLVGDAFKVQPAGINYYRDIFLIWPFLGFAMAATSYVIDPRSSADRIIALKWTICAAVVLFLAKEKLPLAIGASGYVFAHAAFRLMFIHTKQVFLWTLVSGVTLVVLFRSPWAKQWKATYIFPRKLYILDMVVGVSGLATMLLIAHWLTR